MPHFKDETNAPLPELGIWRFWPLRFIAFFFVLIAAYVGCQLLTIVIPKKLPQIPTGALTPAFALLGIAIMITIYRLLVQWTEKRGAVELAAHRAVPHFLIGAILGFGMFAVVIAIDVWLGGAHVQGFAGLAGLAFAFSTALLAGVAEEIIFRGTIYRLLEDGFGTLIAIALSGGLFGLIHAINPGATWASTTAIAVEAGILLAAAYLVTRSLWLAIGLHFGWNFTEGGIFGAAVSGGKTHGLITTTFAGPDWLTGGKFGPEASLTAVAVCVAVAAILLVVAIRHGEWKPLRLKLATA
ncbi:MAG TPA: type II CAAX endopeptidase family protein [Rhizomicrobium sp.]